MSVYFLPRLMCASTCRIAVSATGLLLTAVVVAAEPGTTHPPGYVDPKTTSSQGSHAAAASDARAGTVDLPHAISLAVARAPMLLARQARLEAARQEARRADQLPDPELTVGIDNLPITGEDAFDFSADEMTQKRIGLRQVLPARAKRAAARTLANRRIDEAAANITAESVDVRRETAQAWIDAWAAGRELHALVMLREEAVLASQVAKARVSAGAESPSDALATLAAVIELENRIVGVKAEREAAIAELSRWTGLDIAPSDTLMPELHTLPVPFERLLASVDRSGRLLQTSAQIETASAAVDVARAEKRPDWSVAAAYGQRDGGRSDMLMLEVGVGLPLFTRNRQDRGIAARQAEYDATLHEREDLRRRLAAQVRADIARWEGLKRQVALHVDSLLPLARDRSATALAGYRAGGDLQLWINARRDEVQAHLSHAEHLGELGRAWAALAYLLPEEGAQ